MHLVIHRAPFLSLLVVAAAALAPRAAAQAVEDQSAPLTERERAVHLLSRFAYGARPGEIDRVLAMGVDAWLDAQFEPAQLADAALQGRLSEFESLKFTAADLEGVYRRPLRPDATDEERREYNRKTRIPRTELLNSVVLRAVASERQLLEVMSDFWRNHLNVSYTKGRQIDTFLTPYERDVVQANALGSFPEMLAASAHHPAMLIYLDNYLSRRPPTNAELNKVKRAAEARTGSRAQAIQAVALAEQNGLNENYARELLELHTLGVDNGYSQRDVVALAEALTGWSFDRGNKCSFRFRNDMHQHGDRRVLGRRFSDNSSDGRNQGEAILAYLGAHKGTAEFIATKLVRYLVNDEPPAALVAEVAKTYARSDGDVRAMLRTIVASEDFWARRNFRAKFKTPWEFVVSALRATGARVDDPEELLRRLTDMGQPLYHCDDPTGWYDTAYAWLDPGVLAQRWQFALDLAEGRIKGVTLPEDLFDDIPEGAPPRSWQVHLTEKVVPGGAGTRTRDALTSLMDEYLVDARVPDLHRVGPQLLGMLIGSPEFQRQ